MEANSIKPHWSIDVTIYLRIFIYSLIIGFFVLPTIYTYVGGDEGWKAIYIYKSDYFLYTATIISLLLILEFITTWTTRKWVLRILILCITALNSILTYGQNNLSFKDSYKIPREFFQLNYGLYILLILFPILIIYYTISTIAYHKTKSSRG